MLIVLRHGEPDSQEGLTPLGVQQVTVVANLLAAHDLAPNLIVSSYPLRAQKTTQTLKDTFGDAVTIVQHDLLNLFDGFSVERFLSSQPRDAQIILLSGHGETMSFFSNYLMDDNDCINLFNIAPDNRVMSTIRGTSQEKVFMPKPSDGVMFMEDLAYQNKWPFYGLVLDGTVIYPDEGKTHQSGIKIHDPFHLACRMDLR